MRFAIDPNYTPSWTVPPTRPDEDLLKSVEVLAVCAHREIHDDIRRPSPAASFGNIHLLNSASIGRQLLCPAASCETNHSKRGAVQIASMRMTGSTHGTQERQNSYEAQSDHHSGTPTKSSRPILVERRWVAEIAYAALVLAAIALIVSPVLRRAGWPLNDGWTSPLMLVQIYAAHLRHLDLFPVWSSSDGTGMGTPILLYYQRTFFYVAGLIYLLLGGELKPAVVVTIAIFLMLGAYGMRSALGVITNSRLFSTVGSLGFLFTNYVFTDWFDPRGDLAEFSALMIVPWLLLWCLILLKDRRFSFMLIPVMVLLVNTHSAIALVSLVSLFVALGTFIAIAGFSGLRSIALRLAITVAATTLLLAPLFLAELRFSKFYDPQTKVTAGGFLSTQQFDSFWSYFYGGLHRWLVPPVVPFVQIDFAIWVPIARCFGYSRRVLGAQQTRTRFVLLRTSCAHANHGVPDRKPPCLPVLTNGDLCIRVPAFPTSSGHFLPVGNALFHHSSRNHPGGCDC